MTSLIIILSIYISNGHIVDNKDTIILEGYRRGSPESFVGYRVPTNDKDNNPLYLEYNASNSFKDLILEAAKDGYYISVNNGFRNNNEQDRLYRDRNRKGIPTAKAGFSNHQRGTAIDIAGCTRNGRPTALYWWLINNAHKFGFKNTVRSERWHWEYVGDNS